MGVTARVKEPPWHVGYVCKRVDEASPVLAAQVRWIEALAEDPRVEHVHVLTPRSGVCKLPANVTIRTFGGSDKHLVLRIASFYRELLKIREPVSFFLVSQGGPYPALLLPWKLTRGRSIYHWKAMPHVSWRMRFYANYCDDLIFTATPSSFPVHMKKVRVVGHGIDTELFQAGNLETSRDLVATGRISSVKRYHQAIRALAACRDRFGMTYGLDVIGPCDSRSQDYRQKLLGLIDELGLNGAVRLRGSVKYHELPHLMEKYRAALNLSDTAFDKSSGEAMAMGIPVITSNPSTLEVLPPDVRSVLAVPREETAAQAQTIHEVLSWNLDRRSDVGKRLRKIIVDEHGLGALFGKILTEIEGNLSRL